MKLGKYLRIFLILFDAVLFTVIIDNLVRGLSPVNQPVFWIAACVEVGLGWLTYRFWMRSLLVKGFKIDKMIVVVLVVVGCSLPNIFYLSDYAVLNPAGSTDLFYYVTVISLIIYSSFIIDKYLKSHRR